MTTADAIDLYVKSVFNYSKIGDSDLYIEQLESVINHLNGMIRSMYEANDNLMEAIEIYSNM